jgi:hypothetical protein
MKSRVAVREAMARPHTLVFDAPRHVQAMYATTICSTHAKR